MAVTGCGCLYHILHFIKHFTWYFYPNSVEIIDLCKLFKLLYIRLAYFTNAVFRTTITVSAILLCHVKVSGWVYGWPSRGIVEIVGISEDCSVTSLPNEIIQRTVGFAGLNCARLVLSLIKPAPTCDDEMFSWWKRTANDTKT